MLLALCKDTVANRDALRIRKVPTQRLGRGFQVVPRGTVLSKVFWRILLDQSAPRYAIVLAPFPIAMLIRPDLALAISQAPLLMFALVYIVESQVLSVPTPDKRRALLSEDEVASRVDRLGLRARDVLGRIAAGRQIADARLHLVVEQSSLRRVPVLTLVSVQRPGEGGDRPSLLDLTPAERAMIAERLFDTDLTEGDLHLANTVQNVFLRDIPFEARSVSAHDRLMAMARAQAEG